MTKQKLVIIVVCAVLLFVAAGISNRILNSGVNVASAPSLDPKVLDEIRNREDIKKQQELIVQETYFVEEKAKAQADKDAAIAKFDAQISSIEKQLEGVRSQKLSFQ